MTYLVEELIRYLPKSIDPWVKPTLAPRLWFLIRKINVWPWQTLCPMEP